MDEREAWHARIEATPDDLDLRQVFGDWLLAQGDSQGALIQLECKALRAPDDPQYRSWRRAAAKLRRDYEATWKPPRAQLEIRGGMVEAVRTALYKSDELGAFDELYARAPALTRLKLENMYADEAQVARAAEHPLWPRLWAIDAWSQGLTAVVAVIEAQPLPRLRALRSVSAPAAAVARLAELLDRVPALGRLELHGVAGGAPPELVARLAAIPRLNALDLSANQLGPAGAQALATSVRPGQLEELRIGEGALEIQGLVALAGAGTLTGLRRLDMRRAGLRGRSGEAGGALAALAAATPALRSLELMGCRLRAEDLPALGDRSLWPALEELSLHGCGLGDAGVAALLDVGRLERLVALNLRGNDLTDRTLRGLATLRSLRLLNLEGNLKLTAEALSRFAARLPATTVTAGRLRTFISDPTNERHGVWLGSTNHRAQDVVAVPGAQAVREPDED